MRSLQAAAAAALTLAAVGCAGTSSGQPAATASTSYSTQAGSVPSPCPARALVIGLGSGVSPMTGEHAIIYKVTNRGPVTCTVEGYPRVVLDNAHGTALPFRYADGGGAYVTRKKPVPVLLAPDASGYILVAKYRCDIGIVDSATAIQITLPIAGRSQFAGREPAGNRGTGQGLPTADLSYCRGGPRDPGQIVYVSPMEPSQLAATSLG